MPEDKALVEYLARPWIETLGFEVVERLEPTNGIVYKVRDGQDLRVFKVGHNPLLRGPFKNLLRENKVLERVDGLEGVSHKIAFYDRYGSLLSPLKNLFLGYFRRDRLRGLLKEYIKGKQLYDGEKISGIKAQKFIEAIVRELHKQGIVNLQLLPQNVVITPATEPYIIDLGIAYFKDEISDKKFKEFREKDLQDLESLCRA